MTGDRGERLDEARVRAEGRDPAERQALSFRLFAGADIDVVEDLEVIREELDGRDDDRAMTREISPFDDVQTLKDYIVELVAEQA